MTVLEIRPSAPVFRPLLTCFSTITAWSAAAMSALPVAKLTGVTQSPNMAGIRYPDRIGHLRRLAVRSDGASDEATRSYSSGTRVGVDRVSVSLRKNAGAAMRL